jgi:AraC-like DNA-binding protein
MSQISATHLLSKVEILWKILEAEGHDPEPVFQKEGIEQAALYNKGLRLPAKKMDALMTTAVELIDDPCFGLRAAEFWHPSHFSALGYAWLASETLLGALKRLNRYIHVISQETEVRIEDRSDVLVLTLSTVKEIPAQMDSMMAIIVSGCRINFGEEFAPVCVNLIHDEPSSCSWKYASFFRCPVHFSSKADSLTFAGKDVNKRLPSGDHHLAGLTDQLLIRYMAELDKDNVMHRVKAILIDILPSGKVTHKRVAERLGMSVRSLQRKLQESDTTFRKVLNDVRTELSLQYISDLNYNLYEVAFSLGFSDYSSFSRAYKRWNGISPSHVRKKKARSSHSNIDIRRT